MKFFLSRFQNIVAFILLMIFQVVITAQNEKTGRFEYRGNARINTKTGITAAMYSIDSKKYNGKPEEIAKQFLSENKSELGISKITDLKHLETIKSPAGNHVGFIQTYNGIPVFGSETVVSINKENRVSMIVNGNMPVQDLKNKAAGISKEAAVKNAIEKVNAEEKTFVMKPKEELYIYRDSLDNCYLTWKINFIAQKPSGDWQVFIDANSGEVLNIANISMGYEDGLGRVFSPDPITELELIGLSDQNNYDDPALYYAYDTLILRDLDNPINGEYRLWGQYARSEDIESPNKTTVKSPTTSFFYNRSQDGFEEVNAYYFIDLQRRYVGSLGFHPHWNNGQDYIRFDAHGERCHYEPDTPYIAFGESNTMGGIGIDQAEDLSVILHEYGHALHDAFMTGTGTFNPPLYYDELKVSEGVGDYMAISYRRTLSQFQPDKVFPWYHNETDFPSYDIRKLEPGYVYENIYWNAQYKAGITWASTMMDIQESGVGRDVVTTLLLTSFSYVSPNSHVQDNIHAMLRADRDIYDGEHLFELFTAFNNRKFFKNDQVSGTISSNTTWSGVKVVTGNVTVTNSATLTISPNTFIYFLNGSSLTINSYATLTANGSLSSPITFDFISYNPSTGNGIKFTNNSMGTINYCKIHNAYYGINEYSWAIDITNSVFSNCYYGIYLYNSSPTIRYCNIHDNYETGIYLINNSSPYLYNNYIRNNDYGVYCITSSNPKFGYGSTWGENDINNNYCGVYSSGNSYPILGQSSPVNGGHNNLVNGGYNVQNYSSGTVYAHQIWWGTTSPAAFKISGSGTTSYTDYLGSSVTVDPAPPLSKDNIYASDNKDIPMLSELDKAYQLISSNNLTEARNVCLNLVNNYPDYGVSFNALNLLKETYTDNELTDKKDIYRSLFSNKGKKDLYAMAGLILSDIDKENKLNQINEVINNYKGESITELALFNKFIYYHFELGDKNNARAISDELDKQFPSSIGAVEAHKILGDEEYLNIHPDMKKTNQNTESLVCTEYSLFSAYPNPFNPTSSIKYALPQQSIVSLEVYNMLGEKVASLVNGVKSAGYHEAAFNAGNLSSGVYIYRLTASSLETGKQFVKSAKMLLLK